MTQIIKFQLNKPALIRFQDETSDFSHRNIFIKLLLCSWKVLQITNSTFHEVSNGIDYFCAVNLSVAYTFFLLLPHCKDGLLLAHYKFVDQLLVSFFLDCHTYPNVCVPTTIKCRSVSPLQGLIPAIALFSKSIVVISCSFCEGTSMFPLRTVFWNWNTEILYMSKTIMYL